MNSAKPHKIITLFQMKLRITIVARPFVTSLMGTHWAGPGQALGTLPKRSPMLAERCSMFLLRDF